MLRNHPAVTRAISAAALFALPLSGLAQAQAWVPDPKEATVSIVFQNAFVENHYFETVRADKGHIQANSLAIDTSLGVTRKLAFDFSLPYVSSKYNGTSPHPTALDNGAFHGTLQDYRFAVRYNLRTKGLVVTPYAAAIIPSHDYAYFAHTAAGMGLRQFQVGAYVAKLLDPIVPGAFVQARYGYGVNEKVFGISHNTSNADLEVGYFVTPSFRAFALGNALITHGGVEYPLGTAWPADLFPHHDQVGKFNHLNVGGGASLSLNDKTDIFGSFARTIAARNGHELARSISVGVSFSLSRARRPQQIAAAADSQEYERSPYEGSLVRCVCQK